LSGPRVYRQMERPRTAHLAILVDDSESMNLPSQERSISSPSRIEQARGLLGAPLVDSLSERHLSVSIWRCSDLAPVPNLPSLQATAPSSALGQALVDVAAKFEAVDLEAIVLLSDGQNTGGVSPLQVAEEIRTPVFTVGFGSTKAGVEIGIDELIAPERAFRGESVPIHVVVSRRGETEPLEVALQLAIDGRLVESEKLRFSADQSRYEWKTQKVFQALGSHRLEVRIEPGLSPSIDTPDAAREISWSKSADLSILRNRYTVVLLSGRPGWETKYAGRALEEDPRLAVLAVWPKPQGGLAVTDRRDMAGEADDTDDSIQLLAARLTRANSLDALFDDLSAVDLLVLSDLRTTAGRGREPDLSPERTAKLLEWIQNDGGRALFLGGPQMFASGGPRFAALAPALPVRLEGQSDYRAHPVFPRLTEMGTRSEALASLGSVDSSRLGPLKTHHIFDQAKLGAEVLLEDEAGRPLMAWHSYGSGRVMVIGTDSLWRYGLPLSESPLPQQLFGNLWRESARFLIFGRQGSGIRLYTDGTRFHRGEAVRIWAYIEPNLQAGLDGGRVPVRLHYESQENAEEIYLSPHSQSPTLFEGSFRPQQIGSYTLSLRVGRSLEERQIEITAAREEYLRLAQNEDLLRAIAERSGGRYLTPGDVSQLASALDSPAETEIISRTVFAGSLPWVLPLLLTLLTTEWIFRKRASLP